MALAVLGIAIYPRLGLLGNRGHDVAVTETGEQPGRPQLPDVVELQCTPEGIEVPIGSIRPQDDGLHVQVRNTLRTPTDVWVVDGPAWNSGLVRIEGGETRELVQPVAPGSLTVGCEIGGERQQRRVQLVDVHEIYEEPELACTDADEQVEPPSVEVTENANVATGAVKSALHSLGIDIRGVDVEHYSGYDQPRYSDHTMHPTLEVRDASGQLVAFATLAGQQADDARAPRSPWTEVDFDGCRSFLEGHAPPGGTTTEP